MAKILMLYGINHNMFGKRDPAQYGIAALGDIYQGLAKLAKELSVEIESFQSNSEGATVDRIHQAYYEGNDAVIINAGAWTYYSYGIRDALAILEVPIIEIHMSNIHAREAFRHHSVFADIVQGQICGFGLHTYGLGLRAALASLPLKRINNW